MSNAAVPTPDALLVARCRRGDRDAWDELVNRFARYVSAIALRGFRLNPVEAEDVFQEVFMRVYERIDTLRDDESLRPWISQLTRRICIDRLRARQREEASDELDPAAADDAIAELDQALMVQQALTQLSGDCQDILDRFFSRDQTYATIGDQLGIPPGTIASRISRCLGKMKDLLKGGR
jgi:RNA polymerase sigma factor (sigma-70 family)